MLSTPFTLVYLFRSYSFNDPATTEIYTLSLHDALPISLAASAEIVRLTQPIDVDRFKPMRPLRPRPKRSEEHTSELQSRFDLVCRLLLEKKNLTPGKHSANMNLVHRRQPPRLHLLVLPV